MSPRTDVHVVIVGAGIAGISAAIALKRQLGFENFTIYERSDGVGGTWKHNTYPGCGSDSLVHWYSLSTDLDPNWKNRFATQEDIKAYWERLWHKYGLEKHTVFNTEIIDGKWSNEHQRYTVAARNMKSKEETTFDSQAIIYAIGGIHQPFFPADLPGREQFTGDVFHSAQWRHDIELKGKRVGVIGNGCSAAQFVPIISEDPSTKVVNFCRTPQWYLDRANPAYSAITKFIFAYVPGVLRTYRNWLMISADFKALLFSKKNVRLIAFFRKYFENFIKQKTPAKYHQYLIPKYAPGCKRMIFNPGYLECLHRPNVTLTYDGIETLTERGIKLKTGEEVPLDVVIFATGYQVLEGGIQVQGSKGLTMGQHFTKKGDAMAYLGLCMPGFPNLFTILGPNVATGHASVVFSEEVQINYLIQLLRPIIQGKAKSFEISDKAHDDYNDWLQSRLNDSVWTDCASFYRSGRSDQGRVTATWPGPVALFWWLGRKPQWNLFHSVGAEAWDRQRRFEKARTWGLVSLALGAAGSYLYKNALI